ncbi:unnamed protein product [Tilletia controversa]|nr:unnamed protein product [Tilletia controversa]
MANRGRKTLDLPVTAYGAPAHHIDTNAIGFNGIRSLASTSRTAAGASTSAAATATAATAAAGVPARPVEQIIALNLTQDEENKLPRSERNLLRAYRREHPRPPPSSRAPDLRRLGRTNGGIDPAVGLPAGMPQSDLIPNPMGSGAQRRDPFMSTSSLRTGTNTNVLNATLAARSTAAAAAAGNSSAHSRSTTASGSNNRRVVTPLSGGAALGLSTDHSAPAHDGPAGPRIYSVAMHAPRGTGSASSNHSVSGSESRRRRAEAAAQGIVIPDSVSSLGSLTPLGSEDGRVERRRAQETDGESDSAVEGRKHTRLSNAARRGRVSDSNNNNNNSNGAGRDDFLPSRRKSRGKARKVDDDAYVDDGADDDDDEDLEVEDDDDLGDCTIRAQAGDGADSSVAGPSTSLAGRTTKKAAARRAPARGGRQQRARSPLVEAVLERSRALGWRDYLYPALFCILLNILWNVLDPVEIAVKAGVPARYLPGSRAVSFVSGDKRSESVTTIPAMQKAALDQLEKKVEKTNERIHRQVNKLDAAHRKDAAEWARSLGSTVEDVEKMLNYMHAMSGRVEAVERGVVAVTEGVKAVSRGLGTPLMKGKKANDVVTFADLRVYHADGTGREDLANELAGARVIGNMTTQYGKPKVEGFSLAGMFRSRTASSYSKDLVRVPFNGPDGPGPHWAMQPIQAAGHCWRFPAEEETQLGIQLTRPARLGAFSIEHIPRELVPDRNSAPLDVELWGVVDKHDDDVMVTVAHWRDRMYHELEKARMEKEGAPANSNNMEWDAWVAEGGDGPQPTPPGPEWVLLGTMKYDASLESSSSSSLEKGKGMGMGMMSDIQMVEIKPSVKRLKVDFEKVQFRFRGNHGADNTCVYRVRVHPELDL